VLYFETRLQLFSKVIWISRLLEHNQAVEVSLHHNLLHLWLFDYNYKICPSSLCKDEGSEELPLAAANKVFKTPAYYV
jgi:hypothetical protein